MRRHKNANFIENWLRGIKEEETISHTAGRSERVAVEFEHFSRYLMNFKKIQPITQDQKETNINKSMKDTNKLNFLC